MMRTRKDIPQLLNDLGLTDTGVEVGVFGGIFSERILSAWPGHLLLVDSWAYLEDYDDPLYRKALGDRSPNSRQMTPEQWNAIMNEALERVEKFSPRFRVIRLTSVEAAKTIEDDSLDFVYIDANHSYRAVKQDLEIWYPKLKRGGVFSGHDYFNGDHRGSIYGVKQAVDEFIEAHQIATMQITSGKEWPSSWYWIKS